MRKEESRGEIRTPDPRPEDAIKHYEVGIRIGELSLGAAFDGVLPWGVVDNRPFLRCMSGYGLCLWRLGKTTEAAAVFERMIPLQRISVVTLVRPS